MNILLVIYLLGVVLGRFLLPAHVASKTNPWLVGLAWPILVGMMILPHLMKLLQQEGRSASLHDPTPTPVGYADATSVRSSASPTRTAPPPPDFL